MLDTGSQVSTITESFYNEHLAQENDLVDVGHFISISAYIRMAKFYRAADTEISHVDVLKITIIIKICFTLVCCHLLNDSLFAYLGFSYFMHIGHKVYVFYDHPHLVKNVRNNLKKHGFNVDGNMVQWKYIADFYHADSRLPIRMAPKLTSKHIELQPFAPLSVKLATKVLSDSVAVGITTMVNLGALPKMLNTLLFLLGGWTECSTHYCLCWADGQNVHCCLCGADGQNVQCVQDAQHTGCLCWADGQNVQHTTVFVGRMNRMFTVVFVEWMDRMINTLLSLLGG